MPRDPFGSGFESGKLLWTECPVTHSTPSRGGNQEYLISDPFAPWQVPFVHLACGRICRTLGPEFVPYLPAVLPSLLRSAAIQVL